ncbi:TlpA family protein disulfide reductase [Mangrovimonas xylaniphaga]|uniref:TlpA family protein disulfide reductase n=1 Tax=Mangrovimonas xylaniphaga TaxID=1645915 RepID=UPI0006B5307A|nr:TlpA disulfide reductase family protein [Mangrovimonas xylaniphaga]
MSLKHSILFAYTALTIVACQSPADISGVITGAEQKGSKIYLLEPENLQDLGAPYFAKVIDSATIKDDGSFEFRNMPLSSTERLLELAVQPTGKSPNYLETEAQESANYMPIVWQTGETLKISAEWKAFQKTFQITNPSKANTALLNLRDLKYQAYQNYLAGKEWQVEDGSELLEKEHAILEYQTQLMDFADATEYFLPAVVALRWVSPENDYERVPEFLVRQCAKWRKQQAEHVWTQQLCKMSDATNLPVLIGDVFADAALPTLTKDTLQLREHLGSKLTIIDLWASWCAPCRKENREVLVPLWDTYHDDGLQIIAYALESQAATWQAASKLDGADRWLQVSDLQGDNADFLKHIRVQTIPANFILDENGVVIAKNLHGEALKVFLEEHFK